MNSNANRVAVSAVEFRTNWIANGTSAYGSAGWCCFSLALRGSALRIDLDAGLSVRHPSTIAVSKTVSIRCRTRVAVSGFVVQIGVKTAFTSEVAITSTALPPKVGYTWRRKLSLHCFAWRSLLQDGSRSSITCSAACWNVGTAGRRASSLACCLLEIGSSPCRIACWLAMAAPRAGLGHGGPACLGQAHAGPAAQPDVSLLTTNRNALNPAFSTLPVYPERQPVPVGVCSRFCQCPNLCCG